MFSVMKKCPWWKKKKKKKQWEVNPPENLSTDILAARMEQSGAQGRLLGVHPEDSCWALSIWPVLLLKDHSLWRQTNSITHQDILLEMWRLSLLWLPSENSPPLGAHTAHIVQNSAAYWLGPWGTLLMAWRWLSALCGHMWWKERGRENELSGASSYKGTNPIRGPSPVTSADPITSCGTLYKVTGVEPSIRVTGQKFLELTKHHSNSCHEPLDLNQPILWPPYWVKYPPYYPPYTILTNHLMPPFQQEFS